MSKETWEVNPYELKSFISNAIQEAYKDGRESVFEIINNPGGKIEAVYTEEVMKEEAEKAVLEERRRISDGVKEKSHQDTHVDYEEEWPKDVVHTEDALAIINKDK